MPRRTSRARIGEHLTVLARDRECKLLAPPLERIGVAEEQARALDHRYRAPCLERLAGGSHGATDVGALRDLPPHRFARASPCRERCSASPFSNRVSAPSRVSNASSSSARVTISGGATIATL